MSRAPAAAGLALAALLALVAAPLAAGQSSPPAAPRVAFEVSELSPEAGEGVVFTDASDPDFGDARRSWSFGDGGGASGLQVTHAFAEPGTYRVALYVGSGSAFLNLTVVPAQEPEPEAAGNGVLTAAFEVDPSEPVSGSPVRFVDRSQPGAVSIVRWTWDFGDGQGAQGELRPEHTYAEPGTYNVTLTVMDAEGWSDSVSLLLTVAKLAPGEEPPRPVHQVYPDDPGYSTPAPVGLLVGLLLVTLAASLRRRS